MSKRLLLARTLESLGLLRLLEALPSRPGILIVNHHRIGDASQDPFDREVFSATEDELDTQIRYFNRHLHVVGAQELEALVTGRQPLTRTHVALTFDDGYLDNYTAALPILQANHVSALFFLVPEYVGTAAVPWWDEIAFLVRNTPRTQLTFQTPTALTVHLEPDREAAIHRVLAYYKQPGNTQGARMLEELRAQAGCSLPQPARRFLDWDEAAAMQAAGMTIGSHTQTHRILGQIPHDQQHWELATSRQTLESRLGPGITTLAYPVGQAATFDPQTETIARTLGYTLCFSFYGGINTPAHLRPTNLLRGSVNPHPTLFRFETALSSRLGRLPY